MVGGFPLGALRHLPRGPVLVRRGIPLPVLGVVQIAPAEPGNAAKRLPVAAIAELEIAQQEGHRAFTLDPPDLLSNGGLLAQRPVREHSAVGRVEPEAQGVVEELPRRVPVGWGVFLPMHAEQKPGGFQIVPVVHQRAAPLRLAPPVGREFVQAAPVLCVHRVRDQQIADGVGLRPEAVAADGFIQRKHRLQRVEVRSHRVALVRRLPGAGAPLDGAVVLGIPEVLRHQAPGVRRRGQGAAVPCNTSVFRQGIGRKGVPVRSLHRIHRSPLARGRPEPPIVLEVAEMPEKEINPLIGHRQPLRRPPQLGPGGEAVDHPRLPHQELLRGVGDPAIPRQVGDEAAVIAVYPVTFPER